MMRMMKMTSQVNQNLLKMSQLKIQPISQEESDEEKEADFQEDIAKMTLRKYMSDNVRKKYDELLHDATINVEKKKEGDKQRGKFKGYATSWYVRHETTYDHKSVRI